MDWSLIRRLNSYLQELLFALRAGETWRDRLLLARETVLFHVGNATKISVANQRHFQCRVRIGEQSHLLSLRTFAGDLFILYEILAHNSYYIAPELIVPEQVRTIVDCGANIGICSLYFSGRYPNARIIAIEPLERNFNALVSNAAGVSRITPLRGCVVGSESGHRTMSVDRPSWGNSIASAGDGGEVVPAWTVTEIADDHSLERISILKVDIEGGERDLFAHGSFLQKTDVVIVELHGEYSVERFQSDIDPYGFCVRQPDEKLGVRMLMAVRNDRCVAN